MATIKSYTSPEQSKKLVEILPLESADMHYWLAWSGGVSEEKRSTPKVGTPNKDAIKTYWCPCWSLASLLSVLPNNKHITTTLSRGGWKIEPVEYIDKWFCEYEDEVDEDSPCKNFSVSADNPIDACVAMIEKLHEQKLI